MIVFLAVRFRSCLSWFFVFFSCNVEAGGPGRDMREFCHYVLRAGDRVVHGCSIFSAVFFAVRFLPCFFFCFVFFYLATSKEGNGA